MNHLKLIIFDLDGVIFDSEPLHENAKRRILAEGGISENIDLSWSVGQPNKILWNTIISKFHLEKPENELEELQYNYILEEVISKDIKLSEGLENQLQSLRESNIKLGLASSSDRHYVDSVLRYYKIAHYFDYIVAGDEVARKKPEPDIYLKILNLSDVAKHGAIAIEDSKAGSEAAVAAGLKCIGYLNPTSGRQDLSKCCVRINQISQITKVIPELS